MGPPGPSAEVQTNERFASVLVLNRSPPEHVLEKCKIHTRPALFAESQTTLKLCVKLSFNRPDQDLARPGLSRFVMIFFCQAAVIFKSFKKRVPSVSSVVK